MASMKCDTLIEHKKITIICEEVDEKDAYCIILEAHTNSKHKTNAKKMIEVYVELAIKNQTILKNVATSILWTQITNSKNMIKRPDLCMSSLLKPFENHNNV